MYSISRFRKNIWAYYKKNRRNLPWRNTKDPYKILVSEVMLQQTQVSRVLLKYEEFVKKFPNWSTLASASNTEVLKIWQGMGYNRRALYLKKAAEMVVRDFQGMLPQNELELQKLPGIGKATAGAVLTFAFNKPQIFIETNIRRVFIHFFFQKQVDIRDREITILIGKTIEKSSPREWYHALMDYGAMLGKLMENPNRKSIHYKKQTAFEGSLRQVRGAVLRFLVAKQKAKKKQIVAALRFEEKKVERAIEALVKEGFVGRATGLYAIKN